MDIKYHNQSSSPRKFQHFTSGQASYAAYATESQSDACVHSTDVQRSTVTASNPHEGMNRPHREQFKNFHPFKNLRKAPQFVAIPSFFCEAEKRNIHFRAGCTESRHTLSISMFASFEPHAPLQHPGQDQNAKSTSTLDSRASQLTTEYCGAHNSARCTDWKSMEKDNQQENPENQSSSGSKRWRNTNKK